MADEKVKKAPKARTSASPVPQFSWPQDADGDPMVLVSATVSELIGLKNFSNVTIGPAMVTRFVEEGEDTVKAGLERTFADVEGIVAQERQAVLDIIKK